jgi:hypothetical protein
VKARLFAARSLALALLIGAPAAAAQTEAPTAAPDAAEDAPGDAPAVDAPPADDDATAAEPEAVDEAAAADADAPPPELAPDDAAPTAEPAPVEVEPAAPDEEPAPVTAPPDEAAPAPAAEPAATDAPTAAPATPTTGATDEQKKESGAGIEDDAQLTATMGPGISTGGRLWVFRGSAVRMRNRVAARSFVKNLELTYNPEASTTVAVMPSVWYGNWLNISGYVDVSREWTQSDWDTYAGEFLLSDIFLSAAAVNFWTIPYLEINLNASITGVIPTSKGSWASTMVGGLQLSGGINRFFPLLGGLVLSYGGNVGKGFHRYTTGENASSLEHGGCISSEVCGIWASNGVRNVEWTFSNRLGATFLFTGWLGVTANAWVINQRLYPLMKQDPSITFRPEDPTGTLGIQNWRHFARVQAAAFVTPHPTVTFMAGLDTFSPQLAPDGRYRVPGFNRFTQLYCDVLINLGGVASLFFD